MGSRLTLVMVAICAVITASGGVMVVVPSSVPILSATGGLVGP